MRTWRSRVGAFSFLAAFLLLGATGTRAQNSSTICGQVFDAVTRQPIDGAWVLSGEKPTRTNREGRFTLTRTGPFLGLRAIGYAREQTAARPELQIALKP